MLQDDTTTDLNLTDGEGGEATTTTEAPATTTTQVEDRGDNLTPEQGEEINPAALNSVVAEADAGATTEEPESGKTNSPFVPMVRFSQVNEQKNELATKLAEAQAELDRLRAGGQPATAAPATAPAAPAPAPAVDLKAKHREHADALMEGDVDRAVEIAEQIAAENRRIAREEIRLERTQETLQQSLAEASSSAVASFPYLDTPEGAEALELIVLARDKAIAQGVPAPKALTDAVNRIAPKFAPASTTPNSDLPTGQNRPDNRTSNAIARGARDSTAQAPAAVAGIGNRSTESRMDVANMSEAQFASMSEADKRRMRGDL